MNLQWYDEFESYYYYPGGHPHPPCTMQMQESFLILIGGLYRGGSNIGRGWGNKKIVELRKDGTKKVGLEGDSKVLNHSNWEFRKADLLAWEGWIIIFWRGSTLQYDCMSWYLSVNWISIISWNSRRQYCENGKESGDRKRVRFIFHHLTLFPPPMDMIVEAAIVHFAS